MASPRLGQVTCPNLRQGQSLLFVKSTPVLTYVAVMGKTKMIILYPMQFPYTGFSFRKKNSFLSNSSSLQLYLKHPSIQFIHPLPFVWLSPPLDSILSTHRFFRSEDPFFLLPHSCNSFPSSCFIHRLFVLLSHQPSPLPFASLYLFSVCCFTDFLQLKGTGQLW